MFTKKLICGLSLLLMTSPAFADSFVPAGQAEDAKIAMGYDTDTQRFVGECVRGNIEQHGQAKANISFSQTVSESQLEKELGFEAGGKFRYGAAKIGVSANFLKSQRSSGYSIVAVYSGDYKFKNLLLTFADPKNPNAKPEEIEKERLTAVGQAVRKDDTRWMETCGEEYVQQIERGAKLFYSIRIDFSSQTERDLFEASFSYDSSYASAHAHLKNSKNTFSKNTKVTIGALQIGGDVRRVTELFNTKGDGGENGDGASLGFVKCSFGDFAKCDQVMANAWEYATKEFKEQLKYDPNQPTNESGPAYINYITKKYSAAGIYNKYSSVLNKEIINKRKEIEEEFDRQVLLGAQVGHLLNSKTVVLSKRQTKLLKDVDVMIRKNTDKLVKAAEICYNEPVNCPSTANETLLALTIIDDSVFIIEPEDYRQYCELANTVVAQKSIRESIQGMIAATRELEPDAFATTSDQPVNECLISELVFSRNAVIPTLKGRKISTLAPLREFRHFTSIDLSDNLIEDLTPIQSWTQIEELNLHENKLRDLKPLGVLLSLKKIRVSNNQLRDIQVLAALPQLVRVDARNNFPSVECGLFSDNVVCLSASVKTDSNFVPIQTGSAVPLFMPSMAQMPNDKVFITGYGSLGSRFDASSNSFDVIQGFDHLSYGAKTIALQDGTVLVTGGWLAPQQMYVHDPATGALRSIGSLKVSRADHEMTLLKDGRVLITGGWEQPVSWVGTNASYTAEIYDPKKLTTKLVAKMHAPRAWHTATLLEDGNVLLVGGYSHNSSLATAEVFDVATESFKLQKKSMGEGRGGHTATLLDDGTVLIVGGFNLHNQVTATGEIYHHGEKPYFEKVYEPLNRARAHHAAVRLQNGKVLITGGSETIYAPDAPMEGVGQSTMLAVGELFDPSENSFAEVPSKMYVQRARHAMLEIKPGMVLIVGGLDFGSAMNSEVFSYTDTEVDILPLD